MPPKQNLKPDFFVIGAPKCGTTALYEYLRQHPQLYLPRKEFYFFGSDFTYQHPRPSAEYYYSLFDQVPNSTNGTVIKIGDASVWYLYSKKAAEEIKNACPNAKIIALLRNPTDMLYSLHSQQLFAGNEDIADFAEALAAEPERRLGKRIPKLIGCPFQALYYSEVAMYAEQVQRYFNVFGKNNVKIIIFEEFIRDIPAHYRQILQFLEVNDQFRPASFQQINANKTTRYPAVRNLLKKRPSWLIQLTKTIVPVRRWRNSIENKLWQWNAKPEQRPKLNLLLKQQLNELHTSNIAQLEALLERKLPWN